VVRTVKVTAFLRGERKTAAVEVMIVLFIPQPKVQGAYSFINHIILLGLI
jgi:hypothetical protein